MNCNLQLMSFSLFCRRKEGDYRSSVQQREDGNWKCTIFIYFLTWSNTINLSHTDLQICFSFASFLMLDWKTTKIKLLTLNHLWNANLYIFCDIFFCSFIHSLRFLVWDCKIFSATVLICVLEDLPAGPVYINVYCEGVIKTTAQIEYYTAAEEIERIFQKVADPIAFICQVSWLLH